MLALLPTLAVVLSALVVVSDFHARRVPNAWLLLALLLALTIMASGWAMGTGRPLWPSVLGLVVGLLVMLPFHAIGWMGAGDVKFFATLGFLLGMHALLPIWLIGNLLTGAHACFILLSRNPWFAFAPGVTWTRQQLSQSSWWQRSLQARQGRDGLPYAAYLAIGAMVTVLRPDLTPWELS